MGRCVMQNIKSPDLISYRRQLWLAQWLLLWVLTNTAPVPFPVSTCEMVGGYQVGPLGFLRLLQFLPTDRLQEHLDLHQWGRSLLRCYNTYSNHGKIKYKRFKGKSHMLLSKSNLRATNHLQRRVLFSGAFQTLFRLKILSLRKKTWHFVITSGNEKSVDKNIGAK